MLPRRIITRSGQHTHHYQESELVNRFPTRKGIQKTRVFFLNE